MLIETMGRPIIIINAIIQRLRRTQLRAMGTQRHRRYWVRPWLTPDERQQLGQYTRLMPRLKLEDPITYRIIFRMPANLFQELETRLAQRLERERTWMREPPWDTLPAVTATRLCSTPSKWPNQPLFCAWGVWYYHDVPYRPSRVVAERGSLPEENPGVKLSISWNGQQNCPFHEMDKIVVHFVKWTRNPLTISWNGQLNVRNFNFHTWNKKTLFNFF